jgi:hypothetical protein
VAAALVTTAFTVTWAAPPASALRAGFAPKRAAIVFMPGPAPNADFTTLERFAAVGGFDLGFMSSIQGSYTPEQTLLDISAGTRVWTSLYEGELDTPMTLVTGGKGGTIRGWERARRRADSPPADVVPGTLAQLAAPFGGVAYVGMKGRSNREAIVAAGRAGRVAHVMLADRRAVAARAATAWRRYRLLVARIPGGRDGQSALATLERARSPGDLLIVVQAPGALARRLLAIGAAGLSGGKDLRSDSTRIDGLVVSTDVLPTVLDRFGVDEDDLPDSVAGQAIEAHGGLSVDDLGKLRDRLADVGPRRWIVLVLGLLGAAALAAGVGLARGRTALHETMRTALGAALWLPAVLLFTGALAPGPVVEAMLVAVLTATLALAFDALLPWPRSLALAAAVSVVSEVADLALGSSLTARSLLGPNPILGARFYGVGNELEVTLAITGLLGVGAALVAAGRRALVWGFALGAGAIAFALSWGKLGADVGASIMLAAGGAAAAVAALSERPGRRGVVAVLAAPVVAVGALAVLDVATGGNAHFTRSVLNAGGLSDLADIAQRRVELSYRSLTRGIMWLLVAIAVAALVVGIRSRGRLLAPLRDAPGLRAAAYGTTVGVVVGALSNDSGPIILLIGTVYLALFAGYVASAPNRA